MTGPEHYRQAETYARNAADEARKGQNQSATLSLAFAHLHATLALAATIGLSSDLPSAQREAWRTLVGTEASPVERQPPASYPPEVTFSLDGGEYRPASPGDGQ